MRGFVRVLSSCVKYVHSHPNSRFCMKTLIYQHHQYISLYEILHSQYKTKMWSEHLFHGEKIVEQLREGIKWPDAKRSKVCSQLYIKSIQTKLDTPHFNRAPSDTGSIIRKFDWTRQRHCHQFYITSYLASLHEQHFFSDWFETSWSWFSHNFSVSPPSFWYQRFCSIIAALFTCINIDSVNINLNPCPDYAEA